MNFRNLYDIGIEFEFVAANKNGNKLVSDILQHNLRDWQIVHDGSTETPSFSLNGVPLELDHKKSSGLFFLSQLDNQRTITCGGELISPVMCGVDNEYQTQIEALCNLFKYETCQNLFDKNRASIHVHINVGDSCPLPVLHNLVKIFLMFEPFLYKISGFGSNNRGVYNNFIFCRPITSPPVYKYDYKYYPLYSAEALLTSISKKQFFDFLYNSSYCIDHTNKYVPQRYVGSNFYSILVRNSLEFRYANITTRPEYLMSWIKMCQYIVKTAFNRGVIELETTRTLNDTSEYSIDDFDSFLDYIQLSEPYRRILLNLFKESPDIKDTINILSHVDTYGFDPSELHVSPLDENSIKRVKPSNYRDFVTEIESVQKKLSQNRDNKVTEVKDLTFFLEKGKLSEKEDSSQQYITSFSTYVENNPTLLFYRQVGRNYGLLPYSNTETKIAYVKNSLIAHNVCFFYPIFSPGNTHTFTIPRRSDLPESIKGKRVTFSVEEFNRVTFRYKNCYIHVDLSQHHLSGGYYCNIYDVLLDLANDYSFSNPDEVEVTTNV